MVRHVAGDDVSESTDGKRITAPRYSETRWMTMDAEPFRRDNHYVPSTYLRGFADSDNRVSTYRLLVAHPDFPLWKRKSLRGVAYHAYLYTRITAGGETDEIEKWLEHDFETPATAPLRRAISGEQLTPGDWHHIIRFVAAQDVRTPARLLENLQRWQTELPSLIQEVLQEAVEKLGQAKARGECLSPAKRNLSQYIPIRVSKHIDPGEELGAVQAHVISGRGLWLFSLKHVLTHTIMPLLENRWTILSPPDGLTWFTSDDPVIRLNYHDGRYHFKGGWGNSGTEILLPISPRHLLYTKVGHRPPLRGEKPNREQAAMLRRFIAEHAHRMIIAAAPDHEVQELRPRTISVDLVRSEDEQWNLWHENQSSAERRLMAW